jgi:hypothetical protein
MRLKKIGIYILVVLMGVTGCGGRVANPIPMNLPDDDTRSCLWIKLHMDQLDSDMRKVLPKTDKAGTNLICGLAGFVLIVPWFFMDLKGADRIEYDAMRDRYNHLLAMAVEKKYDVGNAQRIPSVAEIKKMSKEEKAEFKAKVEAANLEENNLKET